MSDGGVLISGDFVLCTSICYRFGTLSSECSVHLYVIDVLGVGLFNAPMVVHVVRHVADLFGRLQLIAMGAQSPELTSLLVQRHLSYNELHALVM